MHENYDEFYAVVENAVLPDVRQAEYKPIEPHYRPDHTLSFYEFVACIMMVNHRNRNRRWWGKEHINIMMQAPHILDYFNRAGGLPGENGHPIPATGEVTMERLVTIDPNNMAILLKEWWWKGDLMIGRIQTLDQGEGTPGNRMMLNMIQGMTPTFSARTLVPQRKNRDGTIDVIGPGRMVCFDRVNGPSCEDAYMDISIPVKSIVRKDKFEQVMEGYTDFVLERSETTKRILDDIRPAMESATIGRDGRLYAKAGNETRIIRPERNFRQEISNFMNHM